MCGFVREDVRSATGYELLSYSLLYILQILVQKNNIYFKESIAGTRSPHYIPITFSGEEGKVYNGVPDWLYSGNDWPGKCSLL
jgi:hypothetical protein